MKQYFRVLAPTSSYGHFTEGVDFVYWWSFSGGGSASAVCAAGFFLLKYVQKKTQQRMKRISAKVFFVFLAPSQFYFCKLCASQLFQTLGEMLSYYNGIWFSSHHFGFRSSKKLKFGLNTHMI